MIDVWELSVLLLDTHGAQSPGAAVLSTGPLPQSGAGSRKVPVSPRSPAPPHGAVDLLGRVGTAVEPGPGCSLPRGQWHLRGLGWC